MALQSHPIHPQPDCCTHFQLAPGCCSSGELLGASLDTLGSFSPLWGPVGPVSSSLCSWTQTLPDLKTSGFSCPSICCDSPSLALHTPGASESSLKSSFLSEACASGRAPGCALSCLKCILTAPVGNSVPFPLCPHCWLLFRQVGVNSG